MRMIISQALAAVVAVVQTGCAVPGMRAYWDSTIDDLCAKDGGVHVIERVPISERDIADGVLPLTWPSGRIGVGAPNIGIASKRFMHARAPVYEGTEIRTNLHDWNPEVWRSERPIVRVSDGKVIARRVVYFRRGGDLLPLDNDSGRYCPNDLARQTTSLFAVQ